MTFRVPRQKDINGRELRSIEYLAALDARLIEYGESLEERLKMTKDGWRSFRAGRALIERSLDQVYDTVDDETRMHMRRMASVSEIVIRPSRQAASNDMLVVPANLMKVLVNSSMEAQCAICIKTGCDIRKCELRKALSMIAPPNRIPEKGACPYSEIALCHDLGNYMPD